MLDRVDGTCRPAVRLWTSLVSPVFLSVEFGICVCVCLVSEIGELTNSVLATDFTRFRALYFSVRVALHILFPRMTIGACHGQFRPNCVPAGNVSLAHPIGHVVSSRHLSTPSVLALAVVQVIATHVAGVIFLCIIVVVAEVLVMGEPCHDGDKQVVVIARCGFLVELVPLVMNLVLAHDSAHSSENGEGIAVLSNKRNVDVRVLGVDDAVAHALIVPHEVQTFQIISSTTVIRVQTYLLRPRCVPKNQKIFTFQFRKATHPTLSAGSGRAPAYAGPAGLLPTTSGWLPSVRLGLIYSTSPLPPPNRSERRGDLVDNSSESVLTASLLVPLDRSADVPEVVTVPE